MKKLCAVPGIPAPPATKAAGAAPAFDWRSFIADKTRDTQPQPVAEPEAPSRLSAGLSGAAKGGILGGAGLAGLGAAGKIPWPKVQSRLYSLAKKELGSETPALMSLGRGHQISKALRGVIEGQQLAGKTLAPGAVSSAAREITSRAKLGTGNKALMGKLFRGAMKHTKRPGVMGRLGSLARQVSSRMGTRGKLLAAGIPAALLGVSGLLSGGKGGDK